MGLLRLLVLVYGSVVIVSASKCLPQTAKCSDFWVKIEPHKNLMETEMDLNLWCNKQMRFYECLEEVLLQGKNGSLSNLPTSLLVSKLFAQDLCSDGSNNRKKLLNNAACINQLNTEYCSLPEYLDIVTPDEGIPPSRCSLSEKTFSCIAATIVLNCGFDAGRVYRAMLKITRYSDEVCDIEASEGIPRCDERKQENPERDEKLSEIYYGLVHRIGTIPEEHAEPEESDQEEYTESLSLDKNNEIGVEDVVTEAIKSALDLLDEEESEENALNIQFEESLDTNYKDFSEDPKAYKKHPLITEVYRGILFYNFSGIEYAAYWRQPEFVVIEDINCEHLQPSYLRGVVFRCKYQYRNNDPDCLSRDSTHEKVTPELIRELDPEIPDDSTTEYGPRPAWMKDLDDAYEAKRLRDELKSMTTATETTDIPNIATTGSFLLHLATTAAKPHKLENWWEYGTGFNSIFANDVHEELMDLFMPEPEKYEPPPHNQFRVGNAHFFLIYDPHLINSVENVTCTRLNECHPKGRGLWRCRMWARKIDTCDDCYRGAETTVNDIPVSYVVAGNSADSELRVEKLETIEETTEVKGSGMLEDETPEETVALIFSEDLTSEGVDTDSALESNLNIVSTYGPEVSSEETTEEYVHSEIEEENLVDSSEESGIGLFLLEQKSDSTTERSDSMYTVEDDGLESEEIISVEDEHEALDKNVLVFQGVPGAVNMDDLYTILNVSDDMNFLDS